MLKGLVALALESSKNDIFINVLLTFPGAAISIIALKYLGVSSAVVTPPTFTVAADTCENVTVFFVSGEYMCISSNLLSIEAAPIISFI